MNNILKKRTSVLVRAAIVLISVILQVLTMFLLVRLLQEYASWVYLLIEIASIAVVFVLVDNSSSFNSFWIVIILGASGVWLLSLLYVGTQTYKQRFL